MDQQLLEAARSWAPPSGFTAQARGPYWPKVDKSYQRDTRDIPIPPDFVPDPNPEAFPIPAGAPTITFGLVITVAEGYTYTGLNKLHHQGLRMFQWRVNSAGGIMLNGNATYVDLKVLAGGPDCSTFLILYDYLINTVGVDFLFSPVNPDCQKLSFLAEAYAVPIVNAPDFALAIYQQIPGIPFSTLNHTYSVAANYSLFSTACLQPVKEKGASTITILHAGTIGQDAVPTTERAIAELGLVAVINTTYLDSEKQRLAAAVGDGCSYLRPYIEQLKEVSPDILVYSLGEIYTDQGTECMHRQGYYPRAFWPFASSTLLNTDKAWMTSNSLQNDMWLGGTNTTDPIMVSVSDYERDFIRLWGTSQINLISYSAASTTAGTVLAKAIKLAGSVDAYDIRIAMHSLRFTSIIGEVYLVPGTQVFNHPFFCRQQGTGNQANSTFVIFPSTPSTVEVVYPALVSVPKEFTDSLKQRPWLNTARKVGIGVGAAVLFLLILGGAGAVFYFFGYKYYPIFIPKESVKDSEDAWQ